MRARRPETRQGKKKDPAPTGGSCRGRAERKEVSRRAANRRGPRPGATIDAGYPFVLSSGSKVDATSRNGPCLGLFSPNRCLSWVSADRRVSAVIDECSQPEQYDNRVGSHHAIEPPTRSDSRRDHRDRPEVQKRPRPAVARDDLPPRDASRAPHPTAPCEEALARPLTDHPSLFT